MYRVLTVDTGIKREHGFALVPVGQMKSLIYSFAAMTEREQEEWTHVLDRVSKAHVRRRMAPTPRGKSND